MKQRQPADHAPGTVEEAVNREIDLLLKRLRTKGICPCCVAQGLMYRGAFLHADVAGPEDTVALCMDVADAIEQPDDARVPDTQH